MISIILLDTSIIIIRDYVFFHFEWIRFNIRKCKGARDINVVDILHFITLVVGKYPKLFDQDASASNWSKFIKVYYITLVEIIRDYVILQM